MLYCDACRLSEFLDDLQCRIGIVDIVVGKLFAMKLLGMCD